MPVGLPGASDHLRYSAAGVPARFPTDPAMETRERLLRLVPLGVTFAMLQGDSPDIPETSLRPVRVDIGDVKAPRSF